MPQSHISMCVGALTLSLNERRFFMKNILQNKLFIIIFLFVILVFSFFNSCFASYDLIVYDRDDKAYTFTLNDELMTPKYFYVYYYKTTTSYCMDVLGYICSDYELRVSYFSSNGSTHKKFVFSDGMEHELRYYETKGMSYHSPFETEINKFNKLTLNDLNISQTSFLTFTGFDLGAFIYSNTDIKDVDDNMVFQAPVPAMVTIPGLETVKEVPQAMSQVMRVLIPIGLIVFLSGLLIYLVRLVILRMI